MESKAPKAQQLKFDDFERNLSLTNVNIDLVGIIAKTGELKYANQLGMPAETEIFPIRDVHIYDDTFTMVRLILRNSLAENYGHLKIDDVISLKNVKIMRLQNRFVLTTTPETVIEVNTAAYEVLWLKQWFLHNRKDIVSNNFMQFNNLSMTPAKLKRERIERERSTTPVTSHCSSPKYPRLVSNSINTKEKVINDRPTVDSSLTSPSSPDNSNTVFVKDNDLSQPKIPGNTQIGPVHVISDDENNIKTDKKNKENTKEEVRTSNEETNENINKPDDVKKDVRYETYNALMHSFLKNEWDEVRDQYLVNFITKNSYNLQNDWVYDKLIREMPDVFTQITPAKLKERVFMLSNVKNYLYLMKLCGGEHLTTEKEKSIFIIKVEKLRESMKLIESS